MGCFLLAAIWQPTAPAYVRILPAVEALRRCWISQFYVNEDVIHWRHAGNLPPSSARIDSPYDLDARYGAKGTAEWVGYKVHVAKTGSPAVIDQLEQPYVFFRSRPEFILSPLRTYTLFGPFTGGLQRRALRFQTP